MMDLRHLALILDAGHQKAREWAGPTDAALVVAALAAMTEVAVQYAQHPEGDVIRALAEDFAALADRYE